MNPNGQQEVADLIERNAHSLIRANEVYGKLMNACEQGASLALIHGNHVAAEGLSEAATIFHGALFALARAMHLGNVDAERMRQVAVEVDKESRALRLLEESQ